MNKVEHRIETLAKEFDESTDFSWLYAGFFGVFYFVFHGLWKYAAILFGIITILTIMLFIVTGYQVEMYGDVPDEWLLSDTIFFGASALISAMLAKPAWKDEALTKAKEKAIYEALEAKG